MKVVLVLVILGALAVGLLGPVISAGHLHDDARAAARAGYAQMVNSNSSPASVEQAVKASLAQHRNVTVEAVRITNGTVTVVVQEKMHSFMSGFPGLEGWFTVNATESANVLG